MERQQREETSSRPDGAVEVEFFGVPRLLVGRRTLAAGGCSLGEIAADLAARCPNLLDRVIDRKSGWLLSGYTFVVDERFTREPATPVRPDSSVLLVSSIAGG